MFDLEELFLKNLYKKGKKTQHPSDDMETDDEEVEENWEGFQQFLLKK